MTFSRGRPWGITSGRAAPCCSGWGVSAQKHRPGSREAGSCLNPHPWVCRPVTSLFRVAPPYPCSAGDNRLLGFITLLSIPTPPAPARLSRPSKGCDSLLPLSQGPLGEEGSASQALSPGPEAHTSFLGLATSSQKPQMLQTPVSGTLGVEGDELQESVLPAHPAA